MTWELVPGSGESASAKSRGPWWGLLIVGGIAAVAGIGLMTWPWVTAKWLLSILLGAALIANGLAMVLRRGTKSSGATNAVGVLLMIAGVVMIVFAETAVALLVSFMGVAFTMLGVLWLAIVWGSSMRERVALWIPPILIILAGLAAWIWPQTATSFLAVLIGFFTLVLGGILIWSGFALRKFTLTTEG